MLVCQINLECARYLGVRKSLLGNKSGKCIFDGGYLVCHSSYLVLFCWISGYTFGGIPFMAFREFVCLFVYRAFVYLFLYVFPFSCTMAAFLASCWLFFYHVYIAYMHLYPLFYYHGISMVYRLAVSCFPFSVPGPLSMIFFAYYYPFAYHSPTVTLLPIAPLPFYWFNTRFPGSLLSGCSYSRHRPISGVVESVQVNRHSISLPLSIVALSIHS